MDPSGLSTRRNRGPEVLKLAVYLGWGLEFRVQGSGFRVQGLGFRFEGLGFRVSSQNWRKHSCSKYSGVEWCLAENPKP